MLRKLYDRTLALAGSRSAPVWLAVVSFTESSFFPIPPDAMLAPMVVAKPEHAWRNATICTVASVAGGIAGYAIGYFLAPFAQSLLALIGQSDKFAEFQSLYEEAGLSMVIMGGFSPFPYKVVTIASGVAEFNFALFVAASAATRGARFFLVAGLAKWLGPPVMVFIEKRLGLVTTVAALAVVAVILAVKFWPH
jgi:membrane protein YqaA with SNARE-associated domain